MIPIAFNLVLIRTAQNRAEDEFADDHENVTTIAFNSGPAVTSGGIQSSLGMEGTAHGSSLQNHSAKDGIIGGKF